MPTYMLVAQLDGGYGNIWVNKQGTTFSKHDMNHVSSIWNECQKPSLIRNHNIENEINAKKIKINCFCWHNRWKM